MSELPPPPPGAVRKSEYRAAPPPPPPGAVRKDAITSRGIANAGRVIAQNVGTETLAGIGGVGQTLLGGPKSGGQYVENFRNYYGAKMSPEGRAAIAPVAPAFQAIGEATESMGNTLGGLGVQAARIAPNILPVAGVASLFTDQTQREAAGYAAGRVLPDALMAAGGGSLMARGASKEVLRQTPRKIDDASPAKPLTPEEVEATRISMGSSDADLADKKLVSGKVVEDPIGKEALRQGFKPGVVQAVKVSSPADKAAMNFMLDIYERGQKNTRYATLHRPADVMGHSIRKRVDVLREVNQKAGRDVKQASENLKGKTVDYSGAIDDFLDALKEMDVYVTDKGQVITKGSQIEGLTGLEAGLNRVVKRMWDTRTPDAYDVHRLKKYIDENVGYGRLSEQGLSGKTEAALKRLRHNLNESLKQFPDYADANMRYSDTVEILREMQQLAGMKTDITELSGDRAFGRVARKVFSNYQSRDQLIAALDSLDSVAKKYRGNEYFTDDILNQALFIQEMERKFGSAASASFQGDIEKAVGRAMTEGVKATVVKAAADKTVEFVHRIRGINDEEAVKSLRRLLADQ